MSANAYSTAGVDVEAGYELVRRISKHVDRTTRPGVMGGLGGFGGAFDLSALGVREPVLISGTDGVGTKLMLAIQAGKHDTIGIDCVAMCANDVVAAGAEPLYFLDYIATGRNVPARLERVVAGVAEGCVQAGCALIGGETAEMPGMYGEDDYDLAGFCVGVAEKSQLIDGERDVQTGDVLLGLPSSGLHSNGFSLVRKIVADLDLNAPAGSFEGFDGSEDGTGDGFGSEGFGSNTSLIDVLLTPTKIYVRELLPLLRAGLVKGIAHITGGGFHENIPRMMGKTCAAEIEEGSWEVPPIFGLLERHGKIAHAEMFEIFNMGLGMVVAVGPHNADVAVKLFAESGMDARVVGHVIPREEHAVVIR